MWSTRWGLTIDKPVPSENLDSGDYVICVPLSAVPGGARNGDLGVVTRHRCGLEAWALVKFRRRALTFLLPAKVDPEELQTCTVDYLVVATQRDFVL